MQDNRDRREYQKAWYKKNAEAHKKNVAARSKAYKEALTQEVRALKEASPCTDCDVSYPYYVMQYDHIGNDKVLHIAGLIRNRATRETVFKEIAKCELVCANCHAARTWMRLSSSDGRAVS